MATTTATAQPSSTAARVNAPSAKPPSESAQWFCIYPVPNNINPIYLTLHSIFFAITTGVSIYYLLKFLREGVLPYESAAPNPHHASGETTKDNAWSTEIETGHGNRDSTDSLDRRTEHGGNQQEDEYALLNSTETDEGRHPGRPLSWGEERTGYARPVPPYADYRDEGRAGAPNDALSPGGYDEYRVQGQEAVSRPPPAGTGYSFSGGGPGR